MSDSIPNIAERDPRTHAIISAAMEVHRVLGCGFLEPVYQKALAVELALRGIPFEQKKELQIVYKSIVLECTYIPDFILYDAVIVELKALGQLTTVESAQVLNYLKATGLTIGLLINFGPPKLEFKRFIWSHERSQ